MHPGQSHLKHFKHNYRFISFKVGLGIWRWKRQQSFLIHSEHSQTDICQCINTGISWAYKFTVLTQLHCLKGNLFHRKWQFSNTEVFGCVQTFGLINSVANPSKQGWDRGKGAERHKDWWLLLLPFETGNEEKPNFSSYKQISCGSPIADSLSVQSPDSYIYLLLWPAHPPFSR